MSQSSSIKRGPLSFFAGATYPLRAIALFLAHPHLRGYVLFPILVNLIVGVTVYAALLFGGLRAIDAIITSLPHVVESARLPDVNVTVPDLSVYLPHFSLPSIALPTWLPSLPSWQLPPISLPNWQIPLPQIHWPQITLPQITLPQWSFQLPDWTAALPNWTAEIFTDLLRIVLSVILFLLTGFIFLQFGVLLGAPWYGKLSEEIEKLKTGDLKTIEVGIARDISRAILYELKKLGLTIGIGIPLLLCNFLPGIGTLIATVGSITLAATIVCLDFLDAAVERRRPRFRQKLGIIQRSLPASASFSLVCLGLVSIPLINLLAIPVCVAGGTLFFCDRVQPWLDGKDS